MARDLKTLLALAFVFLAAPVRAQDDDILVPDDGAAAPAAKEKPRVGFVSLVAVGTATRPLAEQVSEGLTKDLATSFEVVPLALGAPAPAGGGQSDAAADEARQKGDKLAAAGKKLIEKLSFGKAEKAFQQALESYRKAPSTFTDVTPVIEAYLGLAEIHARQGDDEKSKEALAAVARLDPEHELDKARFPGVFITTHARARQAVLEEKTAAIVVDRTGAAGKVTVDGREVGDAPVKVTGLPPGAHFVRVEKEGAGVFGAVVTVGPAATESVSPGFTALDADGPLELLALNRFNDAAAARVAEAAKAAGLAAALVGAVGKAKSGVPTVLVAVDAATGKAARIGPLELDSDLLNMTIEALKAREKLGALLTKGGFAALADDALVPGVKAAASLEVAEVTMRYDVKAPREERKSRVTTSTSEVLVPAAGATATQGESGRSILSAGETGTRSSMRDDEEDVLEKREQRRSEFVKEDTPITEQLWFWPTVIGAGVLGVFGLTGGTVVGLAAFEVIEIPDPRERAGMKVNVEIPE